MIVYIVLLILIFLYYFAFMNHKIIYNKRYFLFSSFGSMAVLVGLRGVKTGEDTRHYLEVFDLVNDASWKTVLTSIKGFQISIWGESVEYFFAILNKIVSVFTDCGQIMLLLVSCLTMWLFARFIYRNIYEHVFIATMVFMCNGLFMASFNGIREMLAIAIIINSYEYIKTKNYKAVIAIAVMAFFTHMSSIIMIPFFWLFSKVKNYNKGVRYMALICISLIAAVPILPRILIVIFPMYLPYFTEHFWDNSYNGVIIVWIFELGLVGYMYYTKIKKEGEFFGAIGTIMYVTLAVISIRLWAFSRVMTYFDPFAMFIFGYGSKRIKITARKYYYAAFMLLMLMEYMRYALVPTRNYVFCWNN